MIKGPTDYVPSVEIEVVSRRKAIPLDQNEGIYVRDLKTGQVRAIIGQTYMLNQDEELWEKTLPNDVENLLNQDAIADNAKGAIQDARKNKWQVISYRVPHNSAVQIYDFKEKKAR
jgi:major vault protein